MEKFDKIVLPIILLLIIYDVVGFGIVESAEYAQTHPEEMVSEKTLGELLYDIQFIKILPALFIWGWFFMFFWFIDRFAFATGMIWRFDPLIDRCYTICCILAWLSIPIIIKYSKGSSIKRVIYTFIIPPLIMGIAFTIYYPLH